MIKTTIDMGLYNRSGRTVSFPAAYLETIFFQQLLGVGILSPDFVANLVIFYKRRVEQYFCASNQPTPWNGVLHQNLIVSQVGKTFLTSFSPKGSVSFSPKPAVCPCPEPN
jgi:hypothetical protein